MQYNKNRQYDPSHAFRPVAENELCRHATGFMQMGHTDVNDGIRAVLGVIYNSRQNFFNRCSESVSTCNLQ